MMKVGVIGCGNIADIYFKNSKQYFNNFEIIACADIKEEASKSFAEKYNVQIDEYDINQIYKAKNNLESKIFELEQAFKDKIRSVQNKLDDEYI